MARISKENKTTRLYYDKTHDTGMKFSYPQCPNRPAQNVHHTVQKCDVTAAK